MKNATYLLLALLTMVFFACTPAEDQPNFALLTDGEWQLQAATVDTTSVLSDCRQNDAVNFAPDGDLDYVSNYADCTDAEITGVKWNFRDGGEVVRIKYQVQDDNFLNTTVFEYWRIVELSADRLVLEDDIAEDNDQIPEIRTYGR